MQEHQVTIEGVTRPLPNPFMVLATQNPVEQAGTYPLPEAQIDRFLMRIVVGYPSNEEEKNILRRFMTPIETPDALLNIETIEWMQSLVKQVHIADELLEYIVAIAEYTRAHTHVYLGVSPRASLALATAARARTLLAGRSYVIPDDIKALAEPVLSH